MDGVKDDAAIDVATAGWPAVGTDTDTAQRRTLLSIGLHGFGKAHGGKAAKGDALRLGDTHNGTRIVWINRQRLVNKDRDAGFQIGCHQFTVQATMTRHTKDR